VIIDSEYSLLPTLVLVFLVIDLLIEVGSLRSLLGNLFFWLYWVVYTVAAETALYLLGRGTQSALGGAGLPKILLILIAIVATTTVLQSLTFKVGGKRVLDFSHYLDDYRRAVLSSSGKLVITYERRRVLKQCRLILGKLSYVSGDAASEHRMKQIYAEVMLFGARKPAAVQQEIAKIEIDCINTGASFGNEVARRVAQTDPEWVKNFLAT
jgi:hypothetical protein